MVKFVIQIERVFEVSGSQRGSGLPGSGLKKVGLQGSKAPRQKNWGSRVPWLYFRAPFSKNRHFCPGPKEKKALDSGLHCKHFWAPGLQGPPFKTLRFGNLIQTRNTGNDDVGRLLEVSQPGQISDLPDSLYQRRGNSFG